MIRSSAILLSSIVIGGAVGWGSSRYEASAAGDSAIAVAPIAHLVSSQPQPAAPSGLDLAQLHAAIREELVAASRLQAATTRTADTRAAVAQDPPPNAEVLAQRREAMRQIAGMIGGGEWGSAERDRLHQELPLLDPEQAGQVLEEIVRGLNNGTIHRSTNSPL